MSSLRPRPRCVLLLHASAALLFLFLGTEPAPLSVLAAELRRMGERDEEDMSPQCNPPLPAAALILFLLDLRMHHPCEPGSSQREGVGCPTDEAIPIPMFVPTSPNNAPQIALPTLPTQAPRKYEHTLHFLLQTSPTPPYHHPLAARLGHLVISVFESPSDLGALRPTSSYQQVPCWTTEVPYLPTYARFLSASDEHDDCHPHDLTRPFLSVPRSSENSNMSASPYLGTGGMLVSGKSTFG
ncbi:hypothetical protein CCHR01_19609 [Colletotrichum chrysophilum]|uniref:Uncharacterized protein n=1 Tax=Colletotrichum chrysophilum TaxID=1836956 RepID=A0AAD9EA92_9PEZI|nr:hypothetical protein CCHR01_19609 [Colletotrichum chrysophilum]